MRFPSLRSCDLRDRFRRAQTSLAQDQDAPVAPTQSGPVRGFVNGGVEGFLGIPYAAPPVGDQRWRPPQPVQSWTDVRDAMKFGAYCAAAKSTNGPRSEAEDCLFINVWRPAKTARDARLPVYVFIHGGGFINGSSNQADMTDIVEKTGVDRGQFQLPARPARLFLSSGDHSGFRRLRIDGSAGGAPLGARQHCRVWRRSGESDARRRVRGRLFRLRPSDRSRFGRALFSGDDAERILHQHPLGCGPKNSRRDRRSGRLQGAGRGVVPARRSGGKAH